MSKDDAEQIRDVLHRYCRLLDDRQPEELVRQVYAEDAVDDRNRGAPRQGHRAIAAYFQAALPLLEATSHLLANVEIEIRGDEASAYSRVVAAHWFRGTDVLGPHRPAECVLIGSYEDTLVRLPIGWRIRHRTVAALGPGGLLFGAMPPVFNGFGGITS